MTSVEWLEKELYEWAGGRFYFPPHFFEEAKEMEKKQIIDAWICEDNPLQRISAEQYYNNNYKN